MAKYTRRTFLRNTLAAGATLALGPALARERPVSAPRSGPAALPPQRVVHAHSDQATSWDYSTGWYGNYVDQAVVDAMTAWGVMTLTNTWTLAGAWRALLPAYTAGQIVAIKINLNNAGSCSDSHQIIDALPQPVNAVIRGLKSIGVPEGNVRVYDVTHAGHNGAMPARLTAKVTALYPGVQFYAYQTGCALATGYSANAADQIHFNVPAGSPAISDRPICNALAGADYLINMPIMKRHGMAGVTLGFKNHFGSFDRNDLVHWSIQLSNASYLSTYNALVDIYSNPHFKHKTVLTVGDGLYGARKNNYNEIPSRWPSFGNHSPNSLFFSVDPVAVDCVMTDFLNREKSPNGDLPPGSDDYLRLASAAGLGAYERWDAAQQYHTIDYRLIEVSASAPAYLPVMGG